MTARHVRNGVGFLRGSVGQIEYLLHQRLDALRIYLEQHLRVLLVQIADVRQRHQKARVKDARDRQRIGRLQVAAEQHRVAFLLGGDQLLVLEVVAVRREQRDDEQEDQGRLVGAEVDGEGPHEVHVVVEQPGAGLGAFQLLEVHGVGLLAVDRVEEVLLLGVERDHRAKDQQLDAAALEQMNLLHLQPTSIDCHLHLIGACTSLESLVYCHYVSTTTLIN